MVAFWRVIVRARRVRRIDGIGLAERDKALSSNTGRQEAITSDDDRLMICHSVDAGGVTEILLITTLRDPVAAVSGLGQLPSNSPPAKV
jgi:hypothetical protein